MDVMMIHMCSPVLRPVWDVVAAHAPEVGPFAVLVVRHGLGVAVRLVVLEHLAVGGGLHLGRHPEVQLDTLEDLPPGARLEGLLRVDLQPRRACTQFTQPRGFSVLLGTIPLFRAREASLRIRLPWCQGCVCQPWIAAR
eukprot:9475317-Pyramimonas_sp.AAC.1